MNPQQQGDAMVELAAGYTLGTLDPVQAAAFAAHLAEGCRACEQEVAAFTAVVGQLGYTVSVERPPPTLRSRLLARIRAESPGGPEVGEPPGAETFPAQPHWSIVRSTEGAWEAGAIEGMVVKSLYRDAAAQRYTALVRMAGGVRYPSHRHADTEELYLLAGDLTVEGQVLRAGDFCAAIAGTVHGEVSSEGGCTFLLSASERDAVVEESGAEAPQSGLRFVLAAEGGWRDGGAEGVTIRPLFSDPARRNLTALVRMQAGSSLQRHRHVTVEQSYMLEGDGHVAGQVLQAGDYYRLAAGSVHDVAYTEGGCIFLLLDSRVEVLT